MYDIEFQDDDWADNFEYTVGLAHAKWEKLAPYPFSFSLSLSCPLHTSLFSNLNLLFIIIPSLLVEALISPTLYEYIERKLLFNSLSSGANITHEFIVVPTVSNVYVRTNPAVVRYRETPKGDYQVSYISFDP